MPSSPANNDATEVKMLLDEATNEQQQFELDQMLYARHAEIESLNDLKVQRGTTIPALFNTLYKFIQNPSSVSVETYKRMIDTDDTIGSGIDFLTTCLAARLGTYNHPDKEISRWVNRCLERIDNGWFNVIKELLSATWAGFSVSEKIWANDDNLGFYPKKIVAMPPTTLLFETERTGELTNDGILQYQRNWSPFGLSNGVGYYGGVFSIGYGFLNTGDGRPDPYARFGDLPFPLRVNNSFNYLSIRIPKQKCIHYAFDAQGKFGNPYGRSLLRRCYKFYVLKDSILQMLAVALDRKGTPLTVVYADPSTTLADERKASSFQTNAKGKNVGIRADKAAQEAFSRIHNDSVIVLPGKKGQIFDLDFIQQSSNHQDFIDSLEFCNKSIMRALLLPSLIFSAGDGSGSYALGQEHSATFVKILDGILQGLEDTLLNQLISEMIRYNFSESRWATKGFGTFAHSDFTNDDIERVSRMWDQAINNGIIDTNDLMDLNKMREKLGFAEKTTVPQQQSMGEENANF